MHQHKLQNALMFGAALAIAALLSSPALEAGTTVSSAKDLKAVTAEHENTAVQATSPIGGRFDLIGDGAVMLAKRNPDRPFHATRHFREQGEWTSVWHSVESPDERKRLTTTVWVYGEKQAMTDGWQKFSGNPLACAAGWRHATDESLQVPGPSDGWPADQSLVRGAGQWRGQWLLIFNHGGYAKYGWAAAAADSLAPLKNGKNPFEIVKPFPLITKEARGGKHAPNDWIYVEQTGLWYGPDEYADGPSHLWTSPNLTDWTNTGPIRNMRGHDPGIAWDGKRFHLFNEAGHKIVHLEAEDPTGPWQETGAVLEVGGHTGDADVSFFNNRWHMFFDDGPHRRYKLGYAWTTPEQFPAEWRMTHHVYGPHNPEQHQQWDNPTEDGNRFGTGDADVAVEGRTLYLSHEYPVGLAHRPFSVTDDEDQRVRIKIEADRDGDGEADMATGWLRIKAGRKTRKLPARFSEQGVGQIRVRVRMRTTKSVESPMLRRITLGKPEAP